MTQQKGLLTMASATIAITVSLSTINLSSFWESGRYLHATLSVILFVAVFLFSGGNFVALFISLFLGVCVGVTKELWDKEPDLLDIVADISGLTIGFLIMLAVIYFIQSDDSSRSTHFH